MKSIIDDMNENDKILDEMQKPWGQKLTEVKEKVAQKIIEMTCTRYISDSSLLEESKESISPQKIGLKELYQSIQHFSLRDQQITR